MKPIRAGFLLLAGTGIAALITYGVIPGLLSLQPNLVVFCKYLGLPFVWEHYSLQLFYALHWEFFYLQNKMYH
jgi:hypothetical protein